MSFHPSQENRWRNVIAPALSGIVVDGGPLEPFRVDLSRASDAILDEILRAIAGCTVVVADISAQHELDGLALRNGNVMYEVGLAHATRLPQEVVLFRSDKCALDFDVSGVRVHDYDPDGSPDAAQAKLVEVVTDSLRSLESQRRMAIDSAQQRLTLPAANMLFEAGMQGQVSHPPTRTVGQVLGAVERTQAIALLLDLGALRANVTRLDAASLRALAKDGSNDPPLVSYALTRFGHELLQHVGVQMGVADADVQKLLSDESAAASDDSAA